MESEGERQKHQPRGRMYIRLDDLEAKAVIMECQMQRIPDLESKVSDVRELLIRLDDYLSTGSWMENEIKEL